MGFSCACVPTRNRANLHRSRSAAASSSARNKKFTPATSASALHAGPTPTTMSRAESLSTHRARHNAFKYRLARSAPRSSAKGSGRSRLVGRTACSRHGPSVRAVARKRGSRCSVWPERLDGRQFPAGRSRRLGTGHPGVGARCVSAGSRTNRDTDGCVVLTWTNPCV